MVTFRIMAPANQTVVCVAVLLEQNMPQVNTIISYLPLALAVYSAGISLISIAMRAAVSGSGLLGAVASYGLLATSDIISVHTPGFFDIVFYTQFMLMTGQLSINYPSFYSTFTALFHWSFLEFRNSFAGHGPDNATYVLTYGGAGSVNQVKESPFSYNDKLIAKRLLPEAWQEPLAMSEMLRAMEVKQPVKEAIPARVPALTSAVDAKPRYACGCGQHRYANIPLYASHDRV